MYYGDVQAVLDSYCLRCHREDAGAPFALSTYAEASAWGPAMVAAIDSGRMPPPASDPTCRDYVDSELLVLPDEAAQRIRDWVDAEMPAGDPADDLPPSTQRFVLDEADLTVRVSEPYTPTYDDPTGRGNEYRCFTLDHGRSALFYITALHALIDEHAISHHMVLGKIDKDGADAERGRAPGGFDCTDDSNIAIDGGFIHAWAPGQGPLRFGEGVGLPVSPDESFILQMHYYLGDDDDAGLADQPGYALVTAPSVTTPALMETYGPTDFTVPAGDESYTLTATAEVRQAGQVHAIFPHMHVLGTGYEMSVGESCVARGAFDFDNQMLYYLREPVQAEAGDVMSIACTWNNSASNPELIHSPPQDVSFGERTDQEMCYAFVMVSP